MTEYKFDVIYPFPQYNNWYLLKHRNNTYSDNIYIFQYITENKTVSGQILKVVRFYLCSELTLTSSVSLVSIYKWVVLIKLKKTTYNIYI